MTEDIDLIRVTGVEYVKDYTMRLEFSNGKLKSELPPFTERETFRAIERPPKFRPVRAHPLDTGMVQWGRFRSGLLV